jgi:hypothetical protein
MLTPSLGYEAGKGRELELERKIAARRQLEEAIAGQRLEQPGVRSSLLQRIRDAFAPARRADAGAPEAGAYQKPRQAAAR